VNEAPARLEVSERSTFLNLHSFSVPIGPLVSRFGQEIKRKTGVR